MGKKINKENILDKNIGIDKQLVQKYEKLENELKRLGIDTSPKFRISPPLGSKNLLLYNK